MKPSRYCFLLLLLGVFDNTGCQHIGPGTIMDDRLSYNDAILASWKQQILLNIVRTRYADIPEFIDVSSVVSGYENNHSINGTAGGEIYPRNVISTFLSFGFGGNRSLSDRPTITYTPQTGSEFQRNLMNPFAPATILNLIEGGLRRT